MVQESVEDGGGQDIVAQDAAPFRVGDRSPVVGPPDLYPCCRSIVVRVEVA